MIRLFIACCLLLPATCIAQGFIHKSKKQVLARLSRYNAGDGFENTATAQTDSTITLQVKEKNTGRETNFIYRFDKNGDCKSEEIKASCDTCFKKYLQDALAIKKYKWKKINENQYVSSFSKKLLIELPYEGSTNFSFMVLQTQWSKKLYRLMF
jgi:hypothetical protein